MKNKLKLVSLISLKPVNRKLEKPQKRFVEIKRLQSKMVSVVYFHKPISKCIEYG